MANRLAKKIKMANPSRSCCYLPLADAKRTRNQKINLLVKISEVGFPRKSRGSDWVLLLRVVDHSCPQPGLPVSIFGESSQKLPNVRSTGDLISLLQVEMKILNGQVYCVFQKTVSSFALFNGKTNTEVNAYQTSVKHVVKDHANDLLLQLRVLPLHRSLSGLTKPLSLLRNVEIGEKYDIICKILHVCNISKERMLFVWDGTDLPPLTLQTNLDNEKEEPTPINLEPLPLSKEILGSFPREGSVLRISADTFFDNIYCSSEYWVKLSNIILQSQSGMWKGVGNFSSKVFKLSDEDAIVKHQKRIHDERISAILERLPMSSFPEPLFITEIVNKNAAYATLMDLIMHPQVLHKCRCVVRVIASCPWKSEDLRSPDDGQYRIRLTLEDPTARIHAFIVEDGVIFFGDNPTNDKLTKMMRKLLGMEELGSGKGERDALRNPPWIWCCLMSYFLDEEDPWGSRKYRICDTRLVN